MKKQQLKIGSLFVIERPEDMGLKDVPYRKQICRVISSEKGVSSSFRFETILYGNENSPLYTAIQHWADNGTIRIIL